MLICEKVQRFRLLILGIWWEMKLEVQAEGLDFSPGNNREVVYF